MAEWDVTTASAGFEYLPADTVIQNSAHAIDDNHFLCLHRGSTNDFVVLEVDTSTWAVTTQFFGLNIGSIDSDNNIVQIDSTHFVVGWDGGTELHIQTVEVDTSTWAVTTSASALDIGAGNSPQNWTLKKFDTNHFLYEYRNGATNYMGIAEVNTSTWAVTTSASAYNVSTAYQGWLNPAIELIDANHVVSSYMKGSDGSDYLQVFAINTSTWAITAPGSEINIDTYGNDDLSKIDDTHMLWCYYEDPDADGYAQIITVNTSTWAITTAAAALEFDTQKGSRNKIAKVDTNHFIHTWEGGASSHGYCEVLEVNTSTWVITTAGASVDFSTVIKYPAKLLGLDSEHYILNYSGPDDDGWIQVFEVDGGAVGPVNLKTFNEVAKASVKTIDSTAIASVKSINTIV